MILVTGATGLIGRALVRALVENGQAVRTHSRQEVDFETAEDSDFDRLVSGCSAVVHTAGLVHNPHASDELCGQLNIRPTRCLAQAAKRAGLDTFVFLSTSAVYGSNFQNISEDSTPHPETAYGRSKLDCEDLLKQMAPVPRLIVLRPSIVFGEGDRGNMIALIKQISKGMYVNVAGNKAEKSVICSEDMAQVIRLCLETLPAGQHTLNVSNPNPVGINELSEQIAACLGKSSPTTVPVGLLQAGARAGQMLLGKNSPLTVERLDKLTTSTTLSVERLIALTGFEQRVPLVDALQNEIAWARESVLL